MSPTIQLVTQPFQWPKGCHCFMSTLLASQCTRLWEDGASPAHLRHQCLDPQHGRALRPPPP